MDMSTRDPTERFSDRVHDYVRYRPHYPDTVLQVLREEAGLLPQWVVADVGSGTGISSELFLSNGNRVYAVEPNPAMRQAAESAHHGNARFISIAGTAEDTGLEPASVDLVAAAQAFHWFDWRRAREQFRALLREPRWVVLLWNTRRTEEVAFLAAYEELLQRFGTDYDSVRHDRSESRELASFFGGAYQRHEVQNPQRLDWEHLQGRLLSASYVPAAGSSQRPLMLEALRRIFEQHETGGAVTFDYRTEIVLGRLA